MAATEKNKQTKVKWTGLGLWNVFFIGEFLLGGFGYLLRRWKAAISSTQL